MEAEKNEQPPDSLPYIYVSQGRCARYVLAAKDLQIGGLVSDRFSTCILFAVWNDQRCSLFHIDRHAIHFPKLVVQELLYVTLVGGPVQGALVYRKLSEEAAILLSQLIKKTTGIKLELKKVEGDIVGVSLNFQSGMQVLKKEEMPKSCLRHPQERQFDNTHNVEEIFGSLDNRYRDKRVLIFDGFFWKKIPDEELTPPIDSDFRREFVKLFSKESTQLDYAITMRRGMRCADIEIPADQEESHWMSDDLLLYLRELDFRPLFKGSMQILLGTLAKHQTTDKKFLDQLTTAFSDPIDTAAACFKVLKKYEKDPKASWYQALMIRWGLHYVEDFLFRIAQESCIDSYPNVYINLKTLLNSARELATKNSAAAIVIYQQCLRVIPYCGMTEPTEIILIFLELGMCCKKSGNTEALAEIINVVKILISRYLPEQVELIAELAKLQLESEPSSPTCQS